MQPLDIPIILGDLDAALRYLRHALTTMLNAADIKNAMARIETVQVWLETASGSKDRTTDTQREASDVSETASGDKFDALIDHVAQAILTSASGINNPKIQDDLNIPYRLGSSRIYARRYAAAAIAAIDEWNAR